jgi:pyrroline-5-carboxylate reductase
MSNSVERIAFVGAGAMGGAIARGLVESHTIEASALFVSDLSADVREAFDQLGATTFSDAAQMVSEADPQVVFLAVKPQVLPVVLAGISGSLAGRLVVSIAAGVKLATLEAQLPAGTHVVRCMPNLPMQERSGAVAITRGSAATGEDVALVQDLLSDLGVARVMSESQLDVAGVVCGCAPAFFALFVDCLTRAGIEAGLPAADCRQMVEATMCGTAKQLLASGDHPRLYMERVSSPGGTTIAALRAMEPLLFESALEGVDAALDRTRELAGE